MAAVADSVERRPCNLCGAIVPVIGGYVADLSTIAISFVVPAVCYLYIVYYGLKGHMEGGRAAA